jgi:hypothetical protein
MSQLDPTYYIISILERVGIELKKIETSRIQFTGNIRFFLTGRTVDVGT